MDSMLTAQGPNGKAVSAKEREDCMLSAACKVHQLLDAKTPVAALGVDSGLVL